MNTNDNYIKLRFDGRKIQGTFTAGRVLIGLRVTSNLPLASGVTFPGVFRAGHKIIDTSKVDLNIKHANKDIHIGSLEQLALLCSYEGFDYEAQRYHDNPSYTDASLAAGVITYDIFFPAGLNFYATAQTPFNILASASYGAAAGRTGVTATVAFGAGTVSYITHEPTGLPFINLDTADIIIEPIYGSDKTPISRVSPVFNVVHVPIGETLTSIDIPQNTVQIRFLDRTKPRIAYQNPNIAHLPTVCPFNTVTIDSRAYNRVFTPSQIISQSTRLLNTIEEVKARQGDYILYDTRSAGGVDIDNGTLKIQYQTGAIPQSDTHWIGFVSAEQTFQGQSTLAETTQAAALEDIFKRELYRA